jgi:hypothetical protein
MVNEELVWPTIGAGNHSRPGAYVALVKDARHRLAGLSEQHACKKINTEELTHKF